MKIDREGILENNHGSDFKITHLLAATHVDSMYILYLVIILTIVFNFEQKQKLKCKVFMQKMFIIVVIYRGYRFLNLDLI